MCIVVLCFNYVCVSDMVIEFILCIIKDLSSEWDSHISLFVVFNTIIIIFLGRGRMSQIRKLVLIE